MGRGGALVALLWFALSGVVGAQDPGNSADEMARSLFQAGKVAYEAGKYEDALGYFEDAYNRSQRPQLLFNVGQAADRLRYDEKALTAFKAYLSAFPEAPNRSEVENRIRALERLAESKANAVVTPRAAAQTVLAEEQAPAATQSPARDTETTPLIRKWWLWTAIGGGVVAVVITAVALSSKDTREAPLPSNTGFTVMTLVGAQ